MGGFFGAVSSNDVINEVFYGTDYHSHLGTRRGGMAAYDKELGLQRDIHNIQNSPFRTKFEKVFGIGKIFEWGFIIKYKSPCFAHTNSAPKNKRRFIYESNRNC